MGAIELSEELVKEAEKQLLKDKKILIFPVFSLAITGILFLGLNFFVKNITAYSNIDSTTLGNDTLVLLAIPIFLVYLVYSFATAYFNSVMLLHSTALFENKPVSIFQSFGRARKYTGKLLKWAMYDAFVFTLLKIVEYVAKKYKVGAIGEGIFGLGRLSWRVATYFTLPVLLYEDRSVADSMKRSAQLIKENFAEAFWSHVRIGAVGVMYILIGIVAGLLGAAAVYPYRQFAEQSTAISIFIFGVFLVGALIYTSALKIFFLNILYRYATKKEMPSELRKQVSALMAASKKEGLSKN